jgi:hypothetical protein
VNKEQFKNLKQGDIVRNTCSGNEYVVTSKYDEYVTAVKSVNMTHPEDWTLVRPMNMQTVIGGEHVLNSEEIREIFSYNYVKIGELIPFNAEIFHKGKWTKYYDVYPAFDGPVRRYTSTDIRYKPIRPITLLEVKRLWSRLWAGEKDICLACGERFGLHRQGDNCVLQKTKFSVEA